jgi:hypothetical protein
MVSDRAFILLICVPWGKTFLLPTFLVTFDNVYDFEPFCSFQLIIFFFYVVAKNMEPFDYVVKKRLNKKYHWRIQKAL